MGFTGRLRSLSITSRDAKFLCHETCQYEKPDDLHMVDIREVGKNPEEPNKQGPSRPYLFKSPSELMTDTERSDAVKAFHRALRERNKAGDHKLPHFA